MKLTRIEKAGQPIVTASGECLYELIGAAALLGDARNQSLACSVIPPGKYSAPHYHKLSEETLYILEGSGRMIVDGQVFEMNVGDALLVEPGEVHSIYNDSKSIDLKQLAISSPPWKASDAFPVQGSANSINIESAN
ncbi:MAG: mannose-6-phosphate isomerase-like protein (cupin superfamily) [Planctomycetota bacterium]